MFAPIYTLVVLVVMFGLFVREVYPPEVTAMGAAVALLVAGVLPVDDVLEVFANPAPWTIAAMFILSGGLIRTGVLANLSLLVTRHATERPRRTLAALASVTAGASAVRGLRRRFHDGCTDAQLHELVERMVEQSRASLTTRLYDSFQYLTNGIL